MRNLWLFLPDDAMPLLLVGVGLALLLGFIRPRQALGLVLGIVLVLLAGPLLDALFQALPLWLLILVLVWLGLYLFRSLLAIFIGERAAAEAVGSLAADVIRFGFRLLFLPARILWRAMRKA